MLIIPLNTVSWSVHTHIWPCSYGYPPNPIKVLSWIHFNYKTVIKISCGSLPREFRWWVKHKLSWVPASEKGLVNRSSQEFSLPVGRDALIHLKPTLPRRRQTYFSSCYYLISQQLENVWAFEHEGLNGLPLIRENSSRKLLGDTCN